MTLFNYDFSQKKLVLGTALWGWGIDRNTAFKLLEFFFESGCSIVDTATNYPINKSKKDHGLAIKWLAEWHALNKSFKFSLIVKIGSLDNLGSPDINLSQENIYSTSNNLKEIFENSLSCISIHWDNRGSHQNDNHQISHTLDAMSKIEESGLYIGLSGIKYPKIYKHFK